MRYEACLVAASLAICGLSATGKASPITYSVDRTVGAGSVIGTIETDGATGVLSASGVLAWDLELNGVSASFNLTSGPPPNSAVVVTGSDLTATATALSFNFSGTDGGYFLIQDGLFSGSQYYCDQALGGSTCLQGESVVPQYYTDSSAQIVSRTGTQVIGTATTVPEPGPMALGGLYLAAIAGATLRRRHHS